jgi:hypothetical protein
MAFSATRVAELDKQWREKSPLLRAVKWHEIKLLVVGSGLTALGLVAVRDWPHYKKLKDLDKMIAARHQMDIPKLLKPALGLVHECVLLTAPPALLHADARAPARCRTRDRSGRKCVRGAWRAQGRGRVRRGTTL